MTDTTARWAVRQLVEKKVLRLVKRNYLGHLIEVRLPDEVRTEGASKNAVGRWATAPVQGFQGVSLEKVDFIQTRARRQSIHVREGGKCFWCLRVTPKRGRFLDHVVPQMKHGRNSYRNLVSCCLDCNSRKGSGSAGDHLRRLLREGRLTPREFEGRQRALKELKAGKVKPDVGIQALDKKEDLRSPRSGAGRTRNAKRFRAGEQVFWRGKGELSVR